MLAATGYYRSRGNIKYPKNIVFCSKNLEFMDYTACVYSGDWIINNKVETLPLMVVQGSSAISRGLNV